MELPLQELSVARAMRWPRPGAPHLGSGPVSQPFASPAAGTEDRGLQRKMPPAQRHRRHAERVGAGARPEAGALSRAGQGAAAKLFHRGGVQRQAVDPADDLGDAPGQDRRPWRAGVGAGRGVVCTGAEKRLRRSKNEGKERKNEKSAPRSATNHAEKII